MAVDIKTLRIGSHVEYEGRRMMVYDISAVMNTPNHHIMLYQKNRFEVAQLADLSPIPITPKLLAELGFKTETCGILPEGEFWMHNLKGNPIEVTYWGQLSNSRNRDWSVRVDNSDNDGLGSGDVAYLHELENIIYQCTGIELIEE